MSADPAVAALARVRQLMALYADPELSVASILCDRREPAAVAYRVIGQDLEVRCLRYGELREESERFASALVELGVGAGDRVATLMGKSREYLVALMGIWRIGAVHVPLFTAFAPPAIAFRLTGSKAKAIVCDASQRAKLEPGEDMPAPATLITTGPGDGRALQFHALLAGARRAPAAAITGGDAAMIHIYTSGTTGRPKPVVVPVKALASFQAYAEFALDLRPDDLYWCAADPGWAYGLYFGVLASFTTGVESVLLQGGFSAESTFAVLSGQGVTNFAAAPTVYRSLRASDAPVPRKLALRCASSAGEPLTPEINRWARSALGIAVHDHYGQTEVGMLINNHHQPPLQRALRPGSMGHAMPGWTALVLHEQENRPAAVNELGRVAMDWHASPLAWFGGYLDDPRKSAEKFSADGRWYLTGDRGRVDEDGYFYFSSRDDDVIIMAGYRIGPFEVESVMLTHPAVAECAVIAVPDRIRGEVMEAFVVLRDATASSETLAQELKDWIKKKYAAHAYPRAIHFTSSLPRTPSGKIQRFILRQQRRADPQ
ncbi:MAG TPA: AMP-binding protein [Steroidobacteraceae bacterium]|nr:AMP-binding protein [Steroidobacteraceae bacterium]